MLGILMPLLLLTMTGVSLHFTPTVPVIRITIQLRAARGAQPHYACLRKDGTKIETYIIRTVAYTIDNGTYTTDSGAYVTDSGAYADDSGAYVHLFVPTSFDLFDYQRHEWAGDQT